jgi:hypothetical protein
VGAGHRVGAELSGIPWYVGAAWSATYDAAMSEPSSAGYSPEFGYVPPSSFEAQSDVVTGRRKRKPGSMALGFLLLGLGLVVGVALVMLAIRSFPDVGSYPRVTGEQQPVALTAGRWTVFAEGGGDLPPREITSAQGRVIPVESMSSSQTYEIGGHQGQSVGTISILTDGTYFVTTEPGRTVAFGQGFGSELLRAIGLFLAAALGGLGLGAVGIAVMVISKVRATRHRPATATTRP